MTIYFPDNSYQTPAATPRRFLDKISFNSRFYFYLGFYWHVAKEWPVIKRGGYDRETWARNSYDFFRFVEGCAGRFHITGLNHFREQAGPFVFVGNHMSTMETVVMPALIVPTIPVTFVAKAVLLKYPFFGPMIQATHPILVERTNPRTDFHIVMREGLNWLSQGTSVVIFPQSTRMAEFDPNAFNSMGVKLARRANVPVIPVAVKTDYWGNGEHLRDMGPIHRDRPIHFAFGAPLTVDDNGKQAQQQVIAFIQDHLQKWATP